MKTRDVVKKQYFLNCPVCDEELKGTSSSQVEYNLKLHLDKHKREKNETTNDSN